MPIVIKCYARNIVEVEQLAWLVSGVLKFFKQQIKDGARIHKIDSPAISEAIEVKSDSEIDLLLINITLMMYQTIVWVMQTTTTTDEIRAGLTNFSGSAYPKVFGGTSDRIIPKEIEDSPSLISRWFSP